MSRVPERQDVGVILARLEQQVARLMATSRLAYSSIDDGAVQIVQDGSLRGIVGLQPDGTTAVNMVNAPPPPSPSAPVVEAVLGGLRVTWDGEFVDAVMPLDWQRVEVHVSAAAGFDPDATTLVSSIESPRGGRVAIPLASYAEHFVRLIARNTSGAESDPSAEVSNTPRQIEEPDLSPLLELGGGGNPGPGSITETEIADNAVTTPKVAANAIVAGKIAANAATLGTVDANVITAREVAANQINAGHIVAGTLTAVMAKVDESLVVGTEANNAARLVLDQAGLRLIYRNGTGVDEILTSMATGSTGGVALAGEFVADSPQTGYARLVDGAIHFYSGTRNKLFYDGVDPGDSESGRHRGRVVSLENTSYYDGRVGMSIAAFTPTKGTLPVATKVAARAKIDFVDESTVDNPRQVIEANAVEHFISVREVQKLRISENEVYAASGVTVSAQILRLRGTADVSLTSTAHAFQIGDEASANIRMDANEILALNNGAASTLYLQTTGNTGGGGGGGLTIIGGPLDAPKKIQSGKVSITPVANTATYVQVTFQTPFDEIPFVTTTPETAANTVKGTAVSNITTSGFRCYIVRENTTQTAVHWVAVAA